MPTSSVRSMEMKEKLKFLLSRVAPTTLNVAPLRSSRSVQHVLLYVFVFKKFKAGLTAVSYLQPRLRLRMLVRSTRFASIMTGRALETAGSWRRWRSSS